MSSVGSTIPAYYTGISPYSSTSLASKFSASAAPTATKTGADGDAVTLSPKIQALLDGVLKTNTRNSSGASSLISTLLGGSDSASDKGTNLVTALFGGGDGKSGDTLGTLLGVGGKAEKGVLSQVYSRLEKAAYAGTQKAAASETHYTLDDIISGYNAYKNATAKPAAPTIPAVLA